MVNFPLVLYHINWCRISAINSMFHVYLYLQKWSTLTIAHIWQMGEFSPTNSKIDDIPKWHSILLWSSYYLEDHPRTCKWLITMVNKSQDLWLWDPFLMAMKMAEIHGGCSPTYLQVLGWSSMWMFPKIVGFPPNQEIIHFDRVFHYFHHPFWGLKTPIFGWKHPLKLPLKLRQVKFRRVS